MPSPPTPVTATTPAATASPATDLGAIEVPEFDLSGLGPLGSVAGLDVGAIQIDTNLMGAVPVPTSISLPSVDVGLTVPR